MIKSTAIYTTDTSLPSVPSAAIDGKFVRLSITGRAGSGTVKLYVNGTQFISFPVSGAGASFYTEFVLNWDSVNQTLNGATWLFGSVTSMSSFNPPSFTFSTDTNNTITSFSLIAF